MSDTDKNKPFTIKSKIVEVKKKKEEDAKPKPPPAPIKVDKRYQKRQPLTTKEHDFLQDFYYKKSGYAGRDVLYKQLQAEYDKTDTPTKECISRRRMWEFFLDKQEVNQLYRQAKKSSLAIKPINASNKLDRAQADLIIRGGDTLRKYKGILCVIDVATRMSWTEVLTDTKSKPVMKAFEKILDRVFNSLTDAEKARRKDREKTKKSKTFTILQTNNGSEFKKDFEAQVKNLHIKQIFGVSNKSTSMSLIERFNQTLQSGMERERTATNQTAWWSLVQKHTDFYNNKTNRNLRLKDKDDSDSTYKVYTPNELWKEDRQVLTCCRATRMQTRSGRSKWVMQCELSTSARERGH